MHGEQGALLCASKIVQQVPSIDDRVSAVQQDSEREATERLQLLGELRTRERLPQLRSVICDVTEFDGIAGIAERRHKLPVQVFFVFDNQNFHNVILE